MRLEHIGIAVKDAALVETLYRTLLGIVPYKTETVEREGVRTIFLSTGNTKLELVAAMVPNSPVQKYLDTKGEGLHHLAFEVSDIAATIQRLKAAGFQTLGDEPKSGADGKRIIFLHPKQTHGVLVEFCQSTEVALPTQTYNTSVGDITICERGASSSPVLFLLSDASLSANTDLMLRLEQQFRVLGFAPETTHGKAIETTLNQLQLHDVRIFASGVACEAALEAAVAAPSGIKNLVLHNLSFTKLTTKLLQQVKQPVLLTCTDNHTEASHLFSIRNLVSSAEIAVLPKTMKTHTGAFINSLSGFIEWWCI